jgi:hypothetical protein
MNSYLFLGDTHGDLSCVETACPIAAEHGAEIVQVGDWGFLWPGGSQVKKLSAILKAHNITMRFIDGNHDWFPELWKRAPSREATVIEDNVIYQPRGSAHVDSDGTRFLFMGGAASIDRMNRTVGLSWWPEEEISNQDMAVAFLHDSCDVLVTHDAPQFPPGFKPRTVSGDESFPQKCLRSLNNVKKLRTRLKPSLHVHGHWHHAYVDGVTRGLDCNYARYPGDAYFLWSRGNTGAH